ncbi:MAG: hypothetical protein CME65_08535 [Halobacteriovoraceae bacterium]|nr:hypothetical protein [Halobacteriovoraceae bacterium]|tara:strand:+ start:6611 stop:7090 length:480 start_codon:yes stop_codon:yes gene_type:complete
MLKTKIKEHLLEKAKADLSAALEANESASDYKGSDDLKQEGKYDTRAIEAGYLAGAQAKRVEELKLEVQMIEELPVRDFESGEAAAVGALVKLLHNEIERLYFLSSTAGGSMLNIDGSPVLVISVFSPIGAGAVNLEAGESFELETPSGSRIYEVLEVF